jgi:hypothetical protein
MALKWSISHADRLVVVVATEKVRPDEAQSALTAFAAEGALPYRKLIDARFASHDPTGADIRWLSGAAVSASKNVALGAVAFVSDLEFATDIVEHFKRRMAVERPLRVFRDVASARRWLDDIAPVLPPKGDGT